MQALHHTLGFNRTRTVWLWVLVLLLGGIASAQAQSPQNLFQRANALYGNQQYDSARKLYEGLLSDGYVSTGLYYNAGNAAFQVHRIGYAIYYFEKALESDPGNVAIAHNLMLAKQQQIDRFQQLPELFLESWWHTLYTLLPAQTWMAISIGVLWMLALGMGINLWRRFPITVPRWMLVICGVLFVLSFLVGQRAQAFSHPHDKAILTAAQTDLRSDPDQESSVLGTIHEGCPLQIVDQAPGWTEIVLPDGKEGWIGAGTYLTL